MALWQFAISWVLISVEAFYVDVHFSNEIKPVSNINDCDNFSMHEF